jgi:lipoprotein-anchoring transpeptidase ErfK/SrfK
MVLQNPSASHPRRPANTGPTPETSPPPTTNRHPTQPGLAVAKNVHAPFMANVPATTLSCPTNYPRAVQNTLEMQVALACRGISPGCLDGLIGPQTRSALRSYQQREHLPITGELDNATRERLVLEVPALVTYAVTSNDLVRLQPLSPTWLGKSQQTALEYETLLELVSEKAQTSSALIRRLNRDVDWTNAPPGTLLELPNVSSPTPGTHAAYVNIRLSDKILEAWDENTNLLAHFPCSIARRVEKRPIGELHVAVVVPNPDYTFDPEIFPESAEARELKTKLVLPPGPNNPVGAAWIGLDKPGYGIHGTPNPEQVGHTESHGCFRLANWNAEFLLRLVSIGTPVYVQP